MEQQAISSDLIRGHIDTIILHTLLDGDKFAQQISDAVEEKSEKEYKINQATLYSSLKRLETLKYVNSYWNDADAGGRRKFFKLTPLGKDTVENSLSNWSYSRAIIDKLMDCAPQPIYKTQYIDKVVERIVEVPVEKTVYIEKIVPAQEKIIDKVETKPDTQTSDKVSLTAQTENLQEINFRNILNGLIKATEIQKEQPSEIKPIEKETEIINEPEKLKFNQTIYETDYNDNRSNNGKIDFGDLALKAAKEGYKIRISSKDSYASVGTLLVNKLNVCAAFVTYLLVLLEFLVYSTVYKSTLKLSVVSAIVAVAVLSVFPAVMAISYIKNPNRNLNKRITKDSILTSAIIVFNLILITLAGSLLFNLDFSNTYQVLYVVVVPITLYIDVPLFYVIKYNMSKLNAFHKKRKKTAL